MLHGTSRGRLHSLISLQPVSGLHARRLDDRLPRPRFNDTTLIGVRDPAVTQQGQPSSVTQTQLGMQGVSELPRPDADGSTICVPLAPPTAR